jgi:hypothetical protein
MKASSKALGLALQLCVMRQASSLEILAQQLEISPDNLSSLIHGRRQFKNPLLTKLAATPLLKKGNLSYSKLKALQALDAYTLEELLLAVLEAIRQQGLESLDEGCFERLRQELAHGGFPTGFAGTTAALLQAMPSVPQ